MSRVSKAVLTITFFGFVLSLVIAYEMNNGYYQHDTQENIIITDTDTDTDTDTQNTLVQETPVITAFDQAVTISTTETQVPESVRNARRILDGEITFEEALKQKLLISLDDFLIVKNPRIVPLTFVNGHEEQVSGIQTSHNTSLTVGNGDEEVLEMYVTDDSGRYTGTIPLPKEYGFVYEQVPRLEYDRFAGNIYFRFDAASTSATVFLFGKKIQIANIFVSVSDEEITQISFPVSSRTVGSVRIERTDDSITLHKWNFDFDGNGTTDVSIGNKDYFSISDLEVAFDTISNDPLLSQDERSMVLAWKDSYISLINDR